MNLFESTKLFDLNSIFGLYNQNQIKQTVFGFVNDNNHHYQCLTSSSSSSASSTLYEKSSPPYARLVLYCDNFKLIIIQFGRSLNDEPRKIWIAIDPAKGHIVSMSLNRESTSLLAVTVYGYIYLIPFRFKENVDPINGIRYLVTEEDARVIHCLTLRNPTVVTWWERKHSVLRSSIAIIGNNLGQLAFVDLDQQYEFKLLNLNSAIDSLLIYDELYCQTLLINCHNKLQYHLTLEQFRSIINSPLISSHNGNVHRCSSRKKSGSSSSTTSSGSFLNCMLSYPAISSIVGGTLDQDYDLDETSLGSTSITNPDSTYKPQLVVITEDKLVASQTASVTTSTHTEFFDLLDMCLPMSIFPQPRTRTLFVLKQNKPKFDFDNSPRSHNSSADELSDLSGNFCSISMNQNFSLDVHEFQAQEFNSDSIILATSRLFIVNFESSSNFSNQLLKIIDCGHRFFLLVYPNRLILVSKYFAEQRNYHSSNSPRSPLLLKKSDSLRSNSSGSFRRKNCSTTSYSTISVIEDFNLDSWLTEEKVLLEEEIVDVFMQWSPSSYEPDYSLLSNAHYPMSSGPDLDSILQTEYAAIEAKLSSKIDEIIRIEEKFLVITRMRCYLIKSRQTSFGEYFHREIIGLLDLVDTKCSKTPNSDAACDGDVITRAKYLVDCFIFRRTRSSATFPITSEQSGPHPCQSWQFWITRSALLLMQEIATTLSTDLSKEPDMTAENISKFNHIFRLFELARTPRRRVITSLTYFKLWSRALFYIRKFFESSILQELNPDERLYLSHQMLDCLLNRYQLATQMEQSNENDKTETLRELYQFFRSYRQYYNFIRILTRLIDEGLFQMAKYVAILHADYLQLTRIILRKFHDNFESQPKDVRVQILDLLTSSRMAYTLTLSSRYCCLLKCQFSISVRVIQSYFHFILKQLPHLTSSDLFRLANILNPNRFDVQLLMNNVLTETSGSYLQDSIRDAAHVDDFGHVDNDHPPIQKRDLLNLYIFVLVLCLRRANRKHHHNSNRKISLYDWNFLNNLANDFCNYWSKDEIELKREKSSHYLVSCGTMFSMAIESAKTNQMYLWGKFPYIANQLCNSTETSSPLRHIRTPVAINFFGSILPNVKILSVATGYQHILLLTDAGIFSMGSSCFGQLGLGNMIFESKYPIPIEMFTIGSKYKVVKIEVGSYHSCAVTDDGSLWTWGWALHGQLGHGNIEDEWVPKRLEMWPENGKVIDIAAGYAHTVVLTQSGDLYVFGENSYNQLGLDMNYSDKCTQGKAKCNIPIKLNLTKMFPGSIRMIACGLFHTIVLVDDIDSNPTRRLFCWGLDPKTWRVKMRADRTTTNQQSNTIISQPLTSKSKCEPFSVYEYSKFREINLEKIPDSSSIRKISAGQCHTMILTSDSRCYSFGFGREGQLGLGSNIQSSSSVAEPILELEAIVDISCGAFHTLAIDFEGTIWGWGQNSDYQLDNSPSLLDQSATTPNSSRRNSLLLSLMRRGDDQLMNRLMSLQKNVEWTPIIVHVPISVNSKKDSTNFQTTNTIKVGNYEPIGSMNKEQIPKHLIECMIRYRNFLDLRSILKRFDYFEFPQLCSIVSFLLNDQIGIFRYQSQALIQNVQFELESLNESKEDLAKKYFDEIFCLSRHFLITKHLNESNQLYHLIGIMIQTSIQLDELLNFKCGPFSMKALIQTLLFDSNFPKDGSSISKSPFFGLNLFRIIQEQELIEPSFRTRFELDDQFMIKLFERTELDIESNPTQIVAVQHFLQQFVNINHFYQCPNKQDSTNVTFPLELTWRKILNQFSVNMRNPKQPYPIGDFNNDDNDDDNDDEIELKLESSELECLTDEPEKENLNPSMLFLFKCGHYFNQRQLSNINRTQSIVSTDYSEAITFLLQKPESDQIEKLVCPNCANKMQK